jgi:hypothetical protein
VLGSWDLVDLLPGVQPWSVKGLIVYAGFEYSNGPFRHSFVAYGHDPFKHPQDRLYQIVSYKMKSSIYADSLHRFVSNVAV